MLNLWCGEVKVFASEVAKIDAKFVCSADRSRSIIRSNLRSDHPWDVAAYFGTPSHASVGDG